MGTKLVQPSGIPDAPSDGNTYGRKDANWTVAGGGGGISDAPVDGSAYSRKNANWESAEIIVTNTFYIDNRRIDAYTPTGAITKPFKSINAALSGVVSPSDSNRYLLKVSPNKYNEQITLKPFVQIDGEAVDSVIIHYDGDVVIAGAGMSSFGSIIQNCTTSCESADPTKTAIRCQTGGNLVCSNVFALCSAGIGTIVEGGFFTASNFGILSATDGLRCKSGAYLTLTAGCTLTGLGSPYYDLVVEAGGDYITDSSTMYINDLTSILGTYTTHSPANNIRNDSNVTGITVMDALNELNLEKLNIISINTTYTVKASGGDFTTIQAAIDSLKTKWINLDVTVTISVDPGVFTHTSSIIFRHPQGNRINIIGATPITTTLTSLVSFTGTTGNYSVTLNVANTAGMTIGDYCIIRGSTGTGEHRAIMGCWEITNIPSGTQIVVKNTYRKTVAPTLTVTGGYLDCLKTTLKFNNADGIQFDSSAGHLYNLAIIGNGTSYDGINISQRGNYFGKFIIYLGISGSNYNLGINGFGRYGIAQTSTADLWLWNVVVSNCGSYGIYAYNNAKIAGTGIISSGNLNIGIYATDGAFITATSSFAIGNATVGFYAFNRAGINAETSEAVGNVYSGFQCLGTSYIYAKTTKSINNGYHGYSSSYNGMIHSQSSTATGNGSSINYYGYWSSNGGHIRADSTTSSGNFSGDYYAEHFSFIKVTSYVGSPTFSPAVDTMDNGGAIIRNIVSAALKITEALNLKAGSTSLAPIKLTTGPVLGTPEVGAIEYNNTYHITNSDGIRRHIILAPNTTKVTAAAPYTNDGYIVINIGGVDFKIMTTA